MELLITHSMNHFMRDDDCKEYFSFIDNDKSEVHSADRRSNENIHYNRGKFRAWV